MSKVDQLRALREARFSHSSTLRQTPRPAPPAAPTTNPFTSQAAAAPQAKPQEEASAQVITPQPSPLDSTPMSASASRPDVEPGKKIQAYSDDELAALIRWVLETGQAHDVDDVLDRVMAELGFHRKGKVIRTRVSGAYSQVTQTAA